MSEPQGDDGVIDPGVQQPHRRSVAQRVRGDGLVAERGAGAGRGSHVGGDALRQGVSAERSARPRGKNRRIRCAGALGKPGPQGRGHRLGERRDPVLAAFSEAVDVRTPREMEIRAAQAGELGGAQAGLDREGEERVVAATRPRGAVGGGEQGVDFEVGQEGHELTGPALGGNREHAGNDGCLFWMLQCGIAEQGMDGGQPRVAGAHGVRVVVFEVGQEPADEGRVEIAEFELRRRFGEVGRGEADEPPPRVPVCGDGVRAGMALPDQPVGKERLERGGEGAHADTPRWRSRRSAATCISSGAADRYQ